jgi:hypothetical protein
MKPLTSAESTVVQVLSAPDAFIFSDGENYRVAPSWSDSSGPIVEKAVVRSLARRGIIRYDRNFGHEWVQAAYVLIP